MPDACTVTRQQNDKEGVGGGGGEEMFDKHGVFRIVTVYQVSLPAKTGVSDLWTSMKITSV